MFENMPMQLDPSGQAHVNDPRVQFGDDSRLFVEFHQGKLLDKVASRERGAPVYKFVDFFKQMQPGEMGSVIDRPATEWDKHRFPRHWAAYQAGREQVMDGTPLNLLFPHDMNIVEALKHQKVFTVEALRDMSDTQAQGIGMGGSQFREAARKYLEMAEKGKGFHQMTKQLEKVSAEKDALEMRVQALEAALASKAKAEAKDASAAR